MNTVEFLSHLRKLDVRVWAEGDELRYSAAKGVVTPDLRAELVKRKRDILAFVRQIAASESPRAPFALSPVLRGERVPLSFAQQRLWFVEQLESGTGLYHISNAVRLEGTLDVAALKQSFDGIVQRHEALRTTFATVEGQPVQVIAPTLVCFLPIIDLSDIPEAGRETESIQIARREGVRPFNLAEGPLMRTLVLRLGAQQHVLLLTMHHIVSDGWSMGVLIQELAQHYEAFSQGKIPTLPALPIQYADFAYWQREWLQIGGTLEAQLAYWKEQLGGAPTVLDLPFDRPRPAAQTFRGARQTLMLPPTRVQELEALSQRNGVTLFMTLLAAFQTLLYRYTGQKDLVIGSPIANRNWNEIEALIGFFVNMLALRIHLDGNPSFGELLERVREVTLDAYAHQDLPFEKLVGELQVERNLSRHPLFQVVFVLQNAPLSIVNLPGLILNPWDMDYGTAMFDLMLVVEECEQGLAGIFEYNLDLFDHATITRMMEHFQALLEGIVANADQRLSDLPILAEAERHQLLVEWNNIIPAGDTQTEHLHVARQCIHEIFEAQAEHAPDAVAVVFEDQFLACCELDRRANQLAHHLQSLGVGPETLVGLCMDRSPEMVIGLLGVLKAGGAYVPLDPIYPPERLTFMLEDAQPLVVLTQARLLERASLREAVVICLDTGWELIAQESGAEPASGAMPENSAYMIYTSGSTGMPKGVLVPHRGLCNVSEAQRRMFGVKADDHVLQLASLSFDASTFEIVMALGAGALLCLGTREALLPGPTLLRLMQDLAVTIITITPSALASLPFDHLSTLHTLNVAGEACPAELVGRWAKGRHFFNLYGPTEATIWATAARCAGNGARPPIGRPIANTQVYLLDAYLHPVPIGVPGELCIGGVGLARGYLNRPDLTADRFIPDPFTLPYPLPFAGGEEGGGARSPGEGLRLYRTGDLARYQPNGDIEFVGRMDHQVKVRGFRIELGEIETVLRQHPAVQEALVIVLEAEQTSGSKRLVAYVVLKDGRRTAQDETSSVLGHLPSHLYEGSSFVSELRHYLGERLPEYMLPSTFVFLDALPLAASGKVDRRALPSPEGDRPDLAEAYVEPRTPVEQQLAAIWAQVLGIERVGVHDDFFGLGGDSILSMQVVSRAHQAGLQLTPRDVFQYQTVAKLAAVAGTAAAPQVEQGVVTGPVPLTPIQHWFFAQQLSDPHHFNQSVLLTAPSGFDVARLEQVVRATLEHHDALRLRFEQKDGQWRQVNVAPADEALVMRVDLCQASEAQVAAAIEREAARLQASLNLGTGPLLRVGYFDLGTERAGRLLLVIHHLAVDGVSWRVLLEDVQTAYSQLSRGEAIQLPAKTTSFKHWAERLAAYAQSEALQAELDYWLAEAQPQVASIPTDYAMTEGANLAVSEDSITVALNGDETLALLQQVPQAYHTQIHEVLLTALAQVLAEWTSRNVVLIDLEGHGREEIFEDVALSRTVGWFTSVFPMRVRLNGAAHPGELLQSVKEQVRQVPNRGLGYGILRYLSASGAARLSALPQPEVSFNYLGQFDQVGTSGTLALATESAGPDVSPRASRLHLLDIVGQVVGGQLKLQWIYSRKLYRQSTIKELAHKFMETLRNLVAHCLSPEVGGYSPSDFPLVGVDQGELDKAISLFDF